MLNHTRTKHPQLKQQPTTTAFSTIRRGASWLMLAIIFYFAAATTVQAAPGDLDPTWGNGGIVATRMWDQLVSSGQPSDLHIQPDGKVIVSGSHGILSGGAAPSYIARYNPNGTLDTTFGTNGKILLPGGGEFYHASALQLDGKILAAGYKTVNGNRDFAVARYNPNGTLDTTFGTNGKVFTPVGSGEDVIVDVVLQPDGKIVAIGYSHGGSTGFDFAAVRYNANGSLDNSFGINGKVVTVIGSGNDYSTSAVLQPDGKILVVGSGYSANGLSADILAVRYQQTGELDSSFGTNGIVRTSILYSRGAYDVALQADGKFVVAAYYKILRYNADGSLDPTFATNGIFYMDEVASVAVQSDGKIIGLGSSGDGWRRFAMIRLNPNGTRDASFGINGRVETVVTGDSPGSIVELQPDGKILACGNTNDYDLSDPRIAIVRYLGDSPSTPRTRFDFDGDGKADVAVFRPSNSTWYLQQSQAGFAAIAFGQTGDRIVPADYDGDGRTDVAVYRNGTWYLQRSSLGFIGVAFGAAADIPAPADFDGDARAELAVYRPSNGTWYFYNLANNQTSGIAFGANEDKPVPADYDGDGKADIAVFRPSNGTWYLQRSQLGFTGIAFGISEDKPVPADYDGDGKADVAVFRPFNGAWYLQRSTLGFIGIPFSFESVPTPADYDGDGRADIADFRNFRSENGVWWLQQSTSGFASVAFGLATDTPVPAAFIP